VREIVEGIHKQLGKKTQKKNPNVPRKIAGAFVGNWHHTDPFKQFAKQDTPPGSIRVL